MYIKKEERRKPARDQEEATGRGGRRCRDLVSLKMALGRRGMLHIM